MLALFNRDQDAKLAAASKKRDDANEGLGVGPRSSGAELHIAKLQTVGQNQESAPEDLQTTALKLKMEDEQKLAEQLVEFIDLHGGKIRDNDLEGFYQKHPEAKALIG